MPAFLITLAKNGWRHFNAPFLTFGMRWSTSSSQTVTALCSYGIPAYGYVDDFFTLSPPEVVPLYRAFALSLLCMPPPRMPPLLCHHTEGSRHRGGTSPSRFCRHSWLLL